MSLRIAIWYHCLLYWKQPPEILESAIPIIREQWDTIKSSGLLQAADKVVIGINGGEESTELVPVLFPPGCEVLAHGLQCRSENRTIDAMHSWCIENPEWAVLYLHAKGSTHATDSEYGLMAANWRRAMMEDTVKNWHQCYRDLENGFDSVGSHFMRGMADGTQNLWAGNFFWVTSDYVATLPRIHERDRIKLSGIDALESRYEAEVWIGNGKILPKVKEHKPHGGNGVP